MLKRLVLLDPRLFLNTFDIQEISYKFNQSVYYFKMYSFEKPILIPVVDGVILIELNIDYTNVSSGLMFIKANAQNYNSPKICF